MLNPSSSYNNYEPLCSGLFLNLNISGSIILELLNIVGYKLYGDGDGIVLNLNCYNCKLDIKLVNINLSDIMCENGLIKM